MTNDDIANKLVLAGIKNLKEIGYPDVDAENIITDEVYSSFFKVMLEDNKGNGKQIDAVIDELLMCMTLEL